MAVEDEHLTFFLLWSLCCRQEQWYGVSGGSRAPCERWFVVRFQMGHGILASWCIWSKTINLDEGSRGETKRDENFLLLTALLLPYCHAYSSSRSFVYATLVWCFWWFRHVARRWSSLQSFLLSVVAVFRLKGKIHIFFFQNIAWCKNLGPQV